MRAIAIGTGSRGQVSLRSARPGRRVHLHAMPAQRTATASNPTPIPNPTGSPNRWRHLRISSATPGRTTASVKFRSPLVAPSVCRRNLRAEAAGRWVFGDPAASARSRKVSGASAPISSCRSDRAANISVAVPTIGRSSHRNTSSHGVPATIVLPSPIPVTGGASITSNVSIEVEWSPSISGIARYIALPRRSVRR